MEREKSMTIALRAFLLGLVATLFLAACGDSNHESALGFYF